MSRWFRFYDRALDDPKVQRLPAVVFKGWVNLLCLAARNVTRNGDGEKRNAGTLPSLPDIAFALRISEQEANDLIGALKAAGLLDDAPDGLAPHKWNDLQFQSDPTNAERQRRFRERKRNEASVTQTVTRYETVTKRPPDTDTETDTETEKKGRKKDIGAGASARPRGSGQHARDELMIVLSAEMADAVIDHRQRMRRALTPKAASLLAGQFARCPDPNAAAAMMLERGWQGFNSEWMKEDRGHGRGQGQGKSAAQADDRKAQWRAAIDALNGRGAAREEGALEGDFRVVEGGRY